MQRYKHGLVWVRRDLRLEDHMALKNALSMCESVVMCFIFDPIILDALDTDDQRIPFMIQSLRELDHALVAQGSSLVIHYGPPELELPRIIQCFSIDALFFNRDYEPYAVTRDAAIHSRVSIPVHTFKDVVIFEKDDITTKDNAYYKVFTPYKNRWLQALNDCSLELKIAQNGHFLPQPGHNCIHGDDWFDTLGFKRKTCFFPGGRSHALQALTAFKSRIHRYDTQRDFPGLNMTSTLSVYLRFGCVSIRELVRAVQSMPPSRGKDIWLSELIWRDFYQMIAATHPESHRRSIKPAYDQIQWQGSPEWFVAWCEGRTGFPIVDAAMRQLNTTGFMHNRCRMIVASFLCKTLLINWRDGERYFAKMLLDFDFASNNGGWAWASSSGCDAQPYFRIFNPYTQSKKFDSDGHYIRSFCPELTAVPTKDLHGPLVVPGYPEPIVDYKKHRQLALDMYHVVKAS
ncbi:MAG: cryptochrome/photolyase family protein [Candidatus Marinamargulisbacteria bacterium]